MSLRSIIATALSGIAKVPRAAGRAAAFTAKAIAVAAVWTVRAVVDSATGAVRFVREFVAPTPPVLPAQAQADAYLDAAEAPIVPTPDLDRFAQAHPGLVEHEMRRMYPEAALLQAWMKHLAYGDPSFPLPDMSQVPERVRLWLASLDDAQVERVRHAPLSRLDMHLRARSEADLMPGVAPVLTTEAARADAAARREREVEALARRTGAARAHSADPEQAELDTMAEAAAEASPSPLPFR